MLHLISILLLLAPLIISYTQFEIQKKNLKLNLFKDRLAVRQSALIILQMMANDNIGGKNDEDWHNALNILITSKFLFMQDNAIDDFVKTLTTNFFTYRSFKSNHDQNSMEISKIEAWVIENAQLKMFDKYLILEDDQTLSIIKIKNWFKCKKPS